MRALNLMLNGDKPKLEQLPRDLPWAGIDGGAQFLLEQGIEPRWIFGDLDSFPAAKNFLKTSCSLVEKNNQSQTDLEFALDFLCQFQELEQLNLYGATGGRLDHFLANLSLLRNPKYRHWQLKIIDAQNQLERMRASEKNFYPIENYRYFSLIPLFGQTQISIQGAKYSAENLPLTLDYANATSNEFINNQPIKITSNQDLLVIYSRDK